MREGVEAFLFPTSVTTPPLSSRRFTADQTPFSSSDSRTSPAKAFELNDPEEIRAARRVKKSPGKDSPDEFMGDYRIRRVYKAVPQRVWVNDAIEK